MSRIARQLVATLAILVGVLALGTTAASAHATLESSSPADGQSVLTSPSEIRITFSETVTTISGGLSVLNADGKTVDTGNSEIVGGRTLVAPISETLSDGTYVATYRVLSADGHPVSGSILFGVGNGALDRSAQPSSTGDRLWEIIGGISRFIMYLAALVAAGVAFFLAFIHDRAEDRWRIVPFVRIGSILALLSAIGIVMSQAALLTGKGAGAVTDSTVLRDVLNQNLGWSLALLMIGLAAVHLSTDIPKKVVSQSLAVYGGLAVTVSFAVWGHATELSPTAISLAADAIHATAAALWLGGLVGLVMVLSVRTPETVRATAGIIGRFSRMAFWSVIALTLAGLTLTITGSGASLNSILTTTWGQLVLAKIGLTLIIVLIAAWNRRTLVPSLTSPTENTGELAVRWATLLRTIRAEAVLLVAVVALTAIVVNVPPARTAVVAKADRVDITQRVDTGNVQLSVDPAIVGPNTVAVRYTDGTGQPINVANSMSIEFSQPSAGLEPITRQVPASEAGVFVIQGNELSIPGTWTITIAVRTGDFTEQRTSFEVPVRR
ncbi:MAG: copper resistance protein CopC [Actinobacteria bacterium]|nr:copper resistance protein CopC [Actinomycetota bacterium]